MSRLLAGGRSLADHLAAHGPLPSPGAALIDAVARAGLRGRGGAGFPAATKLAAVAGDRCHSLAGSIPAVAGDRCHSLAGSIPAVAGDRCHSLAGPVPAVAEGRRPVVVVNGTEGEPLSGKDALLLARAPHLVLDGAVLAARAVGAREILVAAPRHVRLESALQERRDKLAIRVTQRAGGFVAGEETAVIAHLEGRPAKPRMKPPWPAERGYRRRPTLVHNVETLAHMALIARGAYEDTRLVTVSGAVRRPGVLEVPSGTPAQAVVEPGEPLRALLVGGYFGGWVEAAGEVTIGGAGVVFALGASACPVAETARLAAWLAAESAGQCGPCVHGLGALAGVLSRMAAGAPERQDFARLDRWTEMVRRRGACAHPDGAARMLASARRVFADELADHAHHGPCRACPA